MARLLLPLLLLLLPLKAQTIADILQTSIFVRVGTSVLQAITATAGDGTSCTLTKVLVSSISARWTCTSSDGKTVTGNAPITSVAAAATNVLLGQGGVLCAVIINPTAAAVTMGGLGTAPAGGIAWQCTTSTTTGATTPLVSGTAVWP